MDRILKSKMGRTAWNPGQKPPYGARLNPKHPLAQGLVGAWLLNEDGGNKVYDIVRGVTATLANGADWQRNGLRTDANTENAAVIIPDHLRLQMPLTIVADIFPLVNGVLYSTVVGLVYDTINSSPYYCAAFVISNTVGNKIHPYWNLNGGYRRITDAPTYPIGQRLSCALIVNGTVKFYMNGNLSGTPQSEGIYNISYAATSSIGFGDWTSNRNPNTIINNFYIYNRELTVAEIASLYANPYQMFEWPVQDFLMGEISAEDFSGWSDLIRNTLKLDYGASTYAGDQLRKTGKYSVGSFPSDGAATKKTTKTFAGIWSSVADLVAQLVGAAQKFYQDCISILAPAGIILKKSTHNFSGALTSIATMIRKGIKSLAGSAAFIGDITKFIGKKIIRTLSTLGELLAQKSGIIYQVCLAGLNFSAQSIKSSSTKLSGAIQTIGTLIKKSLPKSFSGFLNSSAKIIKMPIKLATGTATFIGTISRFIYKKIIRTFTTIGDILTQKTGAIYKSLAAGMTFSGRVIKSYSMKLSGVFQDLGAIIKKPLKIIKGGFTTAASVARLRGRILTAILSSSGAIYKKTFKELLSNLESTGNIIRFIYFSIGAIKSFIGDLLTRVFRTIIGILHHRTYFVPFMDREILLPTDGRTYVIEKDDNTYEINE